MSDDKKVGFKVYESFGDPSPVYDAEVLGSTTAADAYVHRHRVKYDPPMQTGYTELAQLPKLWGRPWDQYALNMVHSLRPNYIRVALTGTGVTLDAVKWRVTVYLEDDNRTIRCIKQEVEVGCVGAAHGYGLQRYGAGAGPEPQPFFGSKEGIRKLEIYAGNRSKGNK